MGADLDSDSNRVLCVDGIRIIDEDTDTVWDWSLYENDADAPVSEPHVMLPEW